MKKQIIYWTDTFEAGEYSRDILMKEEDVGGQMSENIRIGTEKQWAILDTHHKVMSTVVALEIGIASLSHHFALI